MSQYRRAFVPGGTFFFTLVTEGRVPLFADTAARRRLRDAFAACGRERPYELLAIVLLPDHLHAIWTLPSGDADFSTRWNVIKSHFTRAHVAAGGPERGRSGSRVRRRNRGVWQRRFWEHQCRDETDLVRHVDYVHFNPVKHAHATCPHAWSLSSFNRWVEAGCYSKDWCCVCDGPKVAAPDFDWASDAME